MKMKNSEIVTFLNTCTDLKQKRLPVRLAYAIKKNMAAVQEAATVYMEEREELIARYAKKDKKGEYLVKDSCYVFENKDEFEKDMSELLAIETAVKIHTVFENDVKTYSIQTNRSSVMYILGQLLVYGLILFVIYLILS